MTFRAVTQRAGLCAARRTALLLVSVLVISGCGKSDQLFAIRAVAAGVSQADPFFKEDGTLGKDAGGTPRARPIGGVQASNSPGLYGGTPVGEPGGDDGDGGQGGGRGTGGRGGSPGTGRPGGGGGTTGPGGSATPGPDFGGSARPGTCVVGKLKKFLTDPKNSARAREWARVLNIRPDGISGYIDRLTPVVLRHDTLVTNHAYKHGRAVPFDALLQAGIAVLVDRRGLPAVKCSCGNPLRPSAANLEKSSVGFKDGNRKWSGYRQDRIVVVEPPPGKAPIGRLRLVDVENPDRGISRPLGTEGEADTSFDPHARTTVPRVTGLTFAEASGRLTKAGLALAYGGGTPPPDDARVTSSRPDEGGSLEWGTPVTLFVSDPGADGGSDTPPDTGGLTPAPDGSSTGPGDTGTDPATGETGTGATSGQPTGTTPGETGTGETTAGQTGTGPASGRPGTGATPGETTAGATGTGAATGETGTGATLGETGTDETTAGQTGTGATPGETGTGTTTGETGTGPSTTGAATGAGATGETTTGATSAGRTGTGDTPGGTTAGAAAGGTDTGRNTAGGATSGSAAGETTTGDTGSGRTTTGAVTGGTTTGALAGTTTGATTGRTAAGASGDTSTGAGDTATGDSGSAVSGGTGGSGGPSSPAAGTT